MKYLITAIISYLLGSINTAYLFGKAHGMDIREKGSKNAGASNVKVNFGWAAGIFTGLCDMAKAIIAMKLCGHLYPDSEIIPYLAGAMTIVGHIFPVYMGVKGGKGVASALLSEAISRAKALGAKEAYVISDLSFYEKLGFEKVQQYSFYRKE